MKKYIMLSILTLLFVNLVSCGEKSKKIEKIVVQKDEPTRVEAMVLKKKSFESYAVYPGVFKEWDNFTISSEFAGTIEYMPYEIGDFIKKGDIVVKINTSILRAQIKQVKTAKNIAKINFDRVKKLYSKNLTTKSQLDNIKFQVDNAQAQLDILNTNLRKSVIRSPFNGYVVRKMRKKGELSAPGLPIVTVVKLNPIKFILPVPEKDVYKLSKGNILDIKLEANGKMFKGIVYKIGQMSNPSSHTINVELEVKNIKNFDGEFMLRPGMLARAYVPTIREKNGFVVALDPIMKTEKGSFVFIDNNNKAKRVKVDIVSTSNNNALINSNLLKEGDKLITKGMFSLINGGDISIVKLDKNEYRKDYSFIRFICKDMHKDSLDIVRELLNMQNLEIFDLYRDKNGFNMTYKGELPKFLSKCLLKD